MAAAALVLPLWAAVPSSAVAGDVCHPSAGDFDNDGFGDLVAGASLRNVGQKSNSGAITVVYGNASGLSGRDQYLHQNVPGVGSVAEKADRFGKALATGDFNGDDVSDLAVGVPGENGGQGLVHIFYGGGPDGLRPGSDQRITMGASGLPGSPSAGDRFGDALVAGDFNGDGRDDLAIGAPGDDVGAANSGSVFVLDGAVGTLSTAAAKRFTQADLDSAEANARFGSVLAACDFEGNGQADLAIGVPLEDDGGRADAGAVGVLYGSAGTGLTTTGAGFFRQGTSGITGTHEAKGRFGQALAATDVNGDGAGDLAIGAPNSDAAGPADAGAVTVLYGSGTGLRTDNEQQVFQTPAMSPGDADAADRFGWAVAGADFNRDGFGDVAVGVPFEDYNGQKSNLGEVNVLFGTGSGIGPTSMLIRPGAGGVRGSAEVGDRFGEVLAAGDFGGPTFGDEPVFDLAIGVPQEDLGSVNSAGSSHVVFGAGGFAVPGPVKLDYATPNIIGNPAKGDKFGSALSG